MKCLISPPPPHPLPHHHHHHQRKEEMGNLAGGENGLGWGSRWWWIGADEHTACNRLLATDKTRHSLRHQTHQFTGRLSQWVNHFSAGVVRSCGSPSGRQRHSDQRGGNFKTSGRVALLPVVTTQTKGEATLRRQERCTFHVLITSSDTAISDS